jgi:hypothetical protein
MGINHRILIIDRGHCPGQLSKFGIFSPMPDQLQIIAVKKPPQKIWGGFREWEKSQSNYLHDIAKQRSDALAEYKN